MVQPAQNGKAADGPPAKRARVENGLHEAHSVCLVLDYGSQYTQLIARRVREIGVYSMLLPGDVPLVSAAAKLPTASVSCLRLNTGQVFLIAPAPLSRTLAAYRRKSRQPTPRRSFCPGDQTQFT